MFGKYIHPFALNENVEQAKSILRKLGIAPDNEAFQTIRGMLEKKMGWVGVFTRFHFEEKISLDELAQLLDQLNELKSFLARLPKTVAEYGRYEELVDDLNRLEVTRKASRLLQELGSEQKQYVRSLTKTGQERFDKLAQAFYDLSAEQQKGILGKMKTFAPNNLIPDMSKLVDSLSNLRYETVMADIASTRGGARVVLDERKAGILVVRLHTYGANELLSKSTLWCIRDNPSQWKNYVEGDRNLNAQYTVYNFNLPITDSMCMVGVTITPKSKVFAAHSRLDAKVKTSELEKYLTTLGVNVNVLAPPSESDVTAHKKLAKHRKGIEKAAEKRDTITLMELLTPDDVLGDDGTIATAIVTAGTSSQVKKLAEMGCKFTNSGYQLSANMPTPFSKACLASRGQTVEFLLDMGFPHTTEERKYYAKYLLKAGFNVRTELEAVVARLPSKEQCEVASDLVGRRILAECAWFFGRFTLDRDELLGAFQSRSRSLSPALVNILLEKTTGSPFSPKLGTFMSNQYVLAHHEKLDTTAYFLNYIKAHTADFNASRTNSPIQNAAASSVESALDELVQIDLCDSTNQDGAIYCLKMAKNDKSYYAHFERLFTRTEEEHGVSIPNFFMRTLRFLSADTLGYLIKRGIHNRMGKAQDWTKVELLDSIVVNNRERFDLIRLLVLHGVTRCTDYTRTSVLAMAVEARDNEMMKIITQVQEIQDEDVARVVGELLYVKDVEGAVHWVGMNTNSFEDTLSPLVTQRLLAVVNPPDFHEIVAKPLKFSPVSNVSLTFILPHDTAFKIPFLITLDLDAANLLMYLAKKGFYECAKELVKSLTPEFKAKLMALLPGFVNKLVLGAPSTITTEELRSFLVRLMDTNERRLICRWGDYQAG